MSGEGTLNQEIQNFAKATLATADAQDQDTMAFIKIVGIKLIQGKQKAEETQGLLEEIVKEGEIIGKFMEFFGRLKVRVEEEEREKKVQEEKSQQAQVQAQAQAKAIADSKIVVNKSQSDVPAIYKEVEDKRNKHRQHDDKYRDRKYENRESDRKLDNRQSDKKTFSKNEKYQKPQPKIQTAESNAPKTDQPQDQQEQQQPTEERQKIVLPDLQGKTKCRFYPFCTNESCQFFHPTQKCQKFPRCRFKEKCLFQHQACKFGASCTRGDCFYDHPFKNRKSDNPIMNMMQMMMAANSKQLNRAKRPPHQKQQNQQQNQQEQNPN